MRLPKSCMNKVSLSYFFFSTLVFVLAIFDRHIINTPQAHGILGNFLAPAAALCLISFPFAYTNLKKALKEDRKFEAAIFGFALLPGIALLVLVVMYTLGLD